MPRKYTRLFQKKLNLFILLIVGWILYTAKINFSIENALSPIKAIIYSNKIKVKCNPFLHDSPEYFKIIVNGLKYPTILPLYYNKSINYNCLNSNANITKRILIWTGKLIGNYDFNVDLKEFSKLNCPVSNCELTYDKNLLTQSDYVVFNMREKFELPSYRDNNRQKWVFYHYESPDYSYNFDKYTGLFNLTSTYRIDSDFISHYHTKDMFYWTGHNEEFNEAENFADNRLNAAAILVSHCKTHSKRAQYVQELQKYFNVSVYGRCGKPCPANIDCKDIIATKYKFYLAFENSVCTDYITEKFFHMLKYNVIPVVLGGGNYERFVPESGFIHTKNFESPKKLADYLTLVSNNDTLYNSYFKWKKYIQFNYNRPKGGQFCDMCIQLNIDEVLGIQKTFIPDLRIYWSKNDNCIRPSYKF